MLILYSEDKLPTGKHQGKTIADVVKEDPKYIRKFNELYGKLCISDEVVKTTYAR